MPDEATPEEKALAERLEKAGAEFFELVERHDLMETNEMVAFIGSLAGAIVLSTDNPYATLMGMLSVMQAITEGSVQKG